MFETFGSGSFGGNWERAVCLTTVNVYVESKIVYLCKNLR